MLNLDIYCATFNTSSTVFRTYYCWSNSLNMVNWYNSVKSTFYKYFKCNFDRLSLKLEIIFLCEITTHMVFHKIIMTYVLNFTEYMVIVLLL